MSADKLFSVCFETVVDDAGLGIEDDIPLHPLLRASVEMTKMTEITKSLCFMAESFNKKAGATRLLPLQNYLEEVYFGNAGILIFISGSDLFNDQFDIVNSDRTIEGNSLHTHYIIQRIDHI